MASQDKESQTDDGGSKQVKWDVSDGKEGAKNDTMGIIEEDERDLSCGWLGIRPDWLQRFNTAPWLAASVSFVMFSQGITVNGFVYINLSSVEKRFRLPSTATGSLVSVYDLTVTLLIIFVSYFGATRNKARMISLGALIIGLGSLLWAVPHFTTGPYQYDQGYGEQETLCRTNQNVTENTNCDENWESLSYYYIVFVVAQILHGIGASPLYTIGFAYVDENVGYRRAAWYTGVLSAFSIFGPCAGFFIGAIFLTIYTDIGLQDEVTITLSDPTWVGCWWVGFLLGAILCWISAIPMGAFPTELPDTKNIQHERQSQAHYNEKSESTVTRAGFGQSWRDLLPATKVLLTNPTFLIICLVKASLTFIIGGFTPFIPKFLENQFGLNTAAAAVILGATSIPGAAGGTLIGGWVIKKFNLKMKGALKFSLGIAFCTLLLSPIFFLRCPEQQVAGVVASYDLSETGKPSTVDLNNTCNSECQCAGSETFSPVCGSNELVYFDACYAGCSDTVTEDDVKNYYNCSCIDTTDGSAEAVYGKCSVDCWQLPVFAVAFFFIMLLGFMIQAPSTILTLRCVPDSQRAYALGISSIMYRILGSIPGAAGGTLLGGWVLKRFNLKVKGMLKFSIGTGVITLCLTPMFMLRCPENQVAGVVTPYDPGEVGQPDPVNLTHACNVDCQCAGTETYQPVCGANDLVYFDACYAGCKNTPDSGKTYYNCSCIDTDTVGGESPEAESGYCSSDCWQLPVFAVLFFFVMLLGFMLMAPNTVLSLRCVPDSQRAYGLGIGSIIYRLLGSVPGPIVIGAIVDSSCLTWQEICDERGSCWIYDNYMFALKFFVIAAVGFFLALLLIVLTLVVYKAPPEDAENEKENAANEPKDGARHALNKLWKRKPKRRLCSAKQVQYHF
ncbi:solute carrier organic anion transporter family member 4C1-like [Ptychodera flava]|uniref:solute carrier organic anion transporter family member 4C1-like n=1 Tax=Ptychodera flava TaxID=63121 RepID=UPI00396A2B1B